MTDGAIIRTLKGNLGIKGDAKGYGFSTIRVMRNCLSLGRAKLLLLSSTKLSTKPRGSITGAINSCFT